MSQTHLRILRNSNPETVDRDGERKVIIGDLDGQFWKTWTKSKTEKLQLKVAKAQAKLDEMKKKLLHN